MCVYMYVAPWYAMLARGLGWALAPALAFAVVGLVFVVCRLLLVVCHSVFTIRPSFVVRRLFNVRRWSFAHCSSFAPRSSFARCSSFTLHHSPLVVHSHRRIRRRRRRRHHGRCVVALAHLRTCSTSRRFRCALKAHAASAAILAQSSQPTRLLCARGLRRQ